MEKRGQLIRGEIATWLRSRLPVLATEVLETIQDLKVEARDATGLKSEIPWVRVYSASRSRSATEGWYLVYLFSASGDCVYLTLMQGTTRWVNGEYKPRPAQELRTRVEWARDLLATHLTPRSDLVEAIRLGARRSPLGASYEAGAVAALAYERDAIPPEETLELDLSFLVSVLSQLYVEVDGNLAQPGELAPEVADVMIAADPTANRRTSGQGFRLSVSERLAIEKRAVKVARDYLVSIGFDVKDVGATRPYDLHATRRDEQLFVEVKGTTSTGNEVILTQGEVELHEREHPHTMLIVVSSIRLDREIDPPTASSGELSVVHPWSIERTRLTPIAYRYDVPTRS
ncbi:MrcB family domain-containing protein [Actinophytocola sp.]|uniref:MrcB family domain-containing protein n=1 Tax=Actinophytocola sp. TaxID=1872138 RepID=UPI00389A4174